MCQTEMPHWELTEKAIGCAFRVYNRLGFGFLEAVYERSLLIELRRAGLRTEAQFPITVRYDDEIVGEFIADILVEDVLVLELKSVRELAPAHEVQLVNYLTATGKPVGLLLNFGEHGVEVRRKVRDLTLLRDRPQGAADGSEPSHAGASPVDRLVTLLRSQFADITARDDYGWPHPALNVIDCVLSLNRRYDRFVVPRVERFAARRPDVRHLTELLGLIRIYETPGEFSVAELNYNDPARAITLNHVLEYLLSVQTSYPGTTETERLRAWARSARPAQAQVVGIRGFGLGGFQYLRMLFGAQTTKPDRHVTRFVSAVMARLVRDEEALDLLDRAAQLAGVPLREVDHAIWESHARSAPLPVPDDGTPRESRSLLGASSNNP